MSTMEMSDLESVVTARAQTVRETLDQFSRSKILEVYFARLDKRLPENVPTEFEGLYTLEPEEIRLYLLGQQPQDMLLHKVFNLVN